MKLKKVVIKKYKSFSDIQEFAVEDDITLLVGMNESGETAVFKAIAKTINLTYPVFKNKRFLHQKTLIWLLVVTTLLVFGFAPSCQSPMNQHKSSEHNLMFSYPNAWNLQDEGSVLLLVDETNRGFLASKIWIQRIVTTPEMEGDLLNGLQELSVCALSFNDTPKSDLDCNLTLSQSLDNVQNKEFYSLEEDEGELAVANIGMAWDIGNNGQPVQVGQYQVSLFQIQEDTVLIEAVWVDYEDRTDRMLLALDTIIVSIKSFE